MLAFSQLASYNLGEWRDKMNQHLVSQPAIFLLLLVKVKFQLSPSPNNTNCTYSRISKRYISTFLFRRGGLLA